MTCPCLRNLGRFILKDKQKFIVAKDSFSSARAHIYDFDVLTLPLNMKKIAIEIDQMKNTLVCFNYMKTDLKLPLEFPLFLIVF